MSDMGKQILYKRKAMGWTRRQVAAFLGVATDVTVARYETGKSVPQRKYVEKVHEFLRIPASGSSASLQRATESSPTPPPLVSAITSVSASSSGARRAVGSRVNLPAVLLSQDLEQKIKVLTNKDKALVSVLVDRLLMSQ